MNYFTKLALDWAVARLKETSTWAGFALAVQNGLHLHFNSDFTASVVNVGLAIGGLAAVVVKEGATAPAEQAKPASTPKGK